MDGLEYCLYGCELFALYIVVDPQSPLVVSDQIGIAQYFEMVRNRGLPGTLSRLSIGKANDPFKVTDTDLPRLLAEDIEDLQPRWVRQCFQEVCSSLSLCIW